MKLLCTTVFTLAITTTSFPDVFTVDDDGKADFNNIQAAVDAASDGDEIVVAPGTYTSTNTNVVNMSGKAVTLRSSDPSDPDVVAATIIDGEGARRGIHCGGGETLNTVIDGFTITNGNETNGGGMSNYYSSPTVTNCAFTDNVCSDWGSGGGMHNSGSSPTLTNCTFENNTAGNYGGGMFNNSNSSPTLENCTFTGNSAVYGGGGMYNYSSSPTLDTCTFTGNTAEEGGGLYVRLSEPVDAKNPSVLSISGCTFTNNDSVGSGGGIYIQGDFWADMGCSEGEVILAISDCEFNNNTSSDYGAGANVSVYSDCSSIDVHTDFINCSFSENIATRGDGISSRFNGYGLSPETTIGLQDCTFQNNGQPGIDSRALYLDGEYEGEEYVIDSCSFTSNFGGSIRIDQVEDVQILNCDFTQNTAVFGAALITYDRCTLADCEFSNNSSQSGGACHVNAEAEFTDCEFTSNVATAGNGGAILNNSYNALALLNTTFTNNSAVIGRGGAISSAGALILDGCSLSQNSASYGAAIHAKLSNIDVYNSTLESNVANYGGALFLDEAFLTLTNTKILNNTAFWGGGLMCIQSTSDISGGSIFSGNTADDAGAAIYNFISMSLIADTLFCDNAPEDIFGPWTDLGGVSMPGECLDCDENDIPDWKDIIEDPTLDCNQNSIIDSCEIDDGSANDCNGNYVPDSCDIADGISDDTNTNGIPDECEDCDGNNIPDDLDILNDPSLDCQGNGVLDSCEIENGDVLDCNTNDIPDECDIANGTSEDCNDNAIPDNCDIESGESNDNDANGIPDECECLADINGDGFVNVSDVLNVIADWGQTTSVPADINQDGIVDVSDLLIVIANWGACP